MPASQKKILRMLMKERRTILFQQHPDAGEKIKSLFFDLFELSSHAIVGGYWPIGNELDVRPLLYGLIEKGFRCALPCITTEGLLFRVWEPSILLVKGLFQVLEPPSTSAIVIPDVLLVPFLAFDRQGHRLGYGQGHYDRFLHHHKVVTIGIGFRGQEIEAIPRQSHDFALDSILTEEGMVKP